MPFRFIRKLRFPAENASLSKISECVRSEAEKLPFSCKELYAIELAVDEACANIIDHAYCGEGKGAIDLSLSVSEEALQIKIEDDGQRFNPETVPAPDIVSKLELRSERGLGVFLMKRMMDRVFYCPQSEHRNCLILEKAFSKCGQ